MNEAVKNKEIEIDKLLKSKIFQISSLVFVLLPFVIGQRENPVIIFQTIFASVILLSAFALSFLNLYAKTKKIYETFVKTLLLYSVFIVFTAEILGFFKILKFGVILTVWLLFLCFQLYVYLSKNKRMEFGFPKTITFNFETSVLLLILAITFFIAAIYPPNNYDSMTYHIPRIEHWIQNENVSHYETSNLRQTMAAPFAEFVIMHGRILSGGDSLMNLVQWFAFIFSLAVIYRILNMFGIDKKYSIYGVLFFATTPMAILQALTTQTDLVEALFILIIAERFLTWKKEYNIFTAFEFGIALGLATLTKGTAYPLALTFVVVFALISLKHFKQRIIGAVLAAFIAFSINFCHYSRNYIAYGEPLGKLYGTVSDFKLNSFLASFPAHIYINCGVPMPKDLFSHISNKYYEILGIDYKKVFHYGNPVSNSIKDFIKFHEDTAKNPVQMLIIFILGIVLIANKKYKCYRFYTVMVVSVWFMFAYCIPWQPWVTRLQLPLFALSAPMFGFWCFQTRRKKLANIILVIMVFVSVFPLAQNKSRHIFKTLYTSRYKLIIKDENYKNAVSEIDNLKIKNLGIIIGGDSWEYPLFAYDYKNSVPKITHILSNDLGKIDENIDVLFVLERSIPEIDSIIGRKPQRDEPFVLKRDNKTWKIVYSPK
ncbi:MAG: hypothetical protein FWF51_12935 [Chitinivibrionia bacterium]|nr:hypothetical protein [Chitinivibrionia bacterium]